MSRRHRAAPLPVVLVVLALLGGCGGGESPSSSGSPSSTVPLGAAPPSTTTPRSTTTVRGTTPPWPTCFDPALQHSRSADALVASPVTGFERAAPNDQAEFEAHPDNYDRSYSRGPEQIEVLIGLGSVDDAAAGLETERADVVADAGGSEADEPAIATIRPGKAWYLSSDGTFFGFTCPDGRLYGIFADGPTPKLTLKAFMLGFHS